MRYIYILVYAHVSRNTIHIGTKYNSDKSLQVNSTLAYLAASDMTGILLPVSANLYVATLVIIQLILFSVITHFKITQN